VSMFENTTAQPVFPTYLWIHDLRADLVGPLNQSLSDMLDKLTSPRPELAPGTNWQTDQTLHQLPEFSDLVKIINFASDQVLQALEVEHEGFQISSCWANISPKGSIHLPHHHPNNYLSGIYYVHTKDGADRVTFHEPRATTDIIAPRLLKANAYNCIEQSIPVKPGRLVLFPAWLVHSVPPNMSDELRISISFNIMFDNFAETIARAKWTGLPLNVDALRKKDQGQMQ
jgi:uncharacterized protein (TIGR02466 family)